jgi:hypothetical protein
MPTDIALPPGLVLKTGRLGSAVFSEDGLFRYRLTRRWAEGGLMIAWAMKNPSRADADHNDTTVTKCVGYSKMLGGSGLVIGNLGAYVSTDPKALLSAADPRGPHNDYFLRTLGQDADKIMVAWGALSPVEWRLFRLTIGLLKSTYAGALCLGKTKTGAPRHPSRLPYAVGFEPWAA